MIRAGQPTARFQHIAFNGGSDHTPFYADENRPKSQAGKRLLVGIGRYRATQRAGPCHHAADERITRDRRRRRVLDLANRHAVEKLPELDLRGTFIGSEAGGYQLTQARREFRIPERLKQICDMQPQNPNEEGVLILRLDRLALLHRVAHE